MEALGDTATDLSFNLQKPCDTEISLGRDLESDQSVEQNSRASSIRHSISSNTLQHDRIGMVGCLMRVSPTIKSVSSQTSVSSLMPTASVESSSYPRSITNKDVDNNYPSSQKEAV